MADDDNKQLQGVSVEEFNSLKAELEATKANNAKLEKIFNERQTKTLDKEGILKALGLEKAPEKPIADVLSEKFSALNATVEQLQADIKTKDEKLAMNEKRQKVRDLANQYNFIDVNDVLGAVSYQHQTLPTILRV